MINKKGQITLFIIIGIMIIIGSVLFFLLKQNNSNNPENKETTNEIKNYVLDCLDSVGKDVIYLTGIGGGYYELQNFSLPLGITLYYSNGKNNFPSIEKIQNQISIGLKNNFLDCINNFSNFTSYEISFSEPNFKTFISNNSIKIDLTFPIKISINNDKITLKNFNTEFNIPLYQIYALAKYMNEHEKDKLGYCLSCDFNLFKNTNYILNSYDYPKNYRIFSIYEKGENENKFKFVFANEYDGTI